MSQQNISERPRLLLVEDDEAARVSLSRVLSRVGYQIEMAPDGEQAIALLEAPARGEAFDVVLTDLLLHEVDGVQVLKRARQLTDPPEVVLLTGYGTLHTAIEALRAGAFDYLLKPCKPEDLLRCIGEAVRRRHERRAQSDAAAAADAPETGS
jgi:DNA-binding NtrC family response regulator